MRLVAITGKVSQLIAIQPELCKIVPARKETAAVVAKAESEQADGEGNPGGIGRELLTDQPAERHHDRRAGAAQGLRGSENSDVPAGVWFPFIAKSHLQAPGGSLTEHFR